jgi:hypothetical protein
MRKLRSITANTLSKAYSEAGYFARNVRAIEVLIDRDAVTSGAAVAGEPWQHYDLGLVGNRLMVEGLRPGYQSSASYAAPAPTHERLSQPWISFSGGDARSGAVSE